MNRRIGAGGVQLRDCVCCLLLVGVLLVCAGAALAPSARADGDPGSDVLVNQSVFLPPDADVGVAEQTQLDGLLRRAQSTGFPVRVAVIAHPDDLGAVTPLWLQPQKYALFLGIELSMVFKGPLLVVMPNGLGFQWPVHAAASAVAERRLERIKVAAGGRRCGRCRAWHFSPRQGWWPWSWSTRTRRLRSQLATSRTLRTSTRARPCRVARRRTSPCMTSLVSG